MRQAPTVALLCAALVMGAEHGRADVLIEGDAASLHVHASQAPVAEILAALKDRLGVRYPGSVPLDRPITGNFSGSLQQVIARVLDGYDYVLRQADDAIEIILVGRRDMPATSTAGPAPGTPATPSGVNPAASSGQTSLSRIRAK